MLMHVLLLTKLGAIISSIASIVKMTIIYQVGGCIPNMHCNVPFQIGAPEEEA
jgi:hypothetical protein